MILFNIQMMLQHAIVIWVV